MHILSEHKGLRYNIYAALIIGVGTLLRILLAGLGWPLTNSDEDTIGIMGIHIAYRGAHPIFFYGQNYMGALEAYLAAGMFHLFGISVFSLRLGLILLFTLFLISMYILTALLYTQRLALFTLVLLSLGSSAVLTRQLSAIGGYPEILLFGALTLLLASWLALSYQQNDKRKGWQRFLGYGAWGWAVGLGLWSDLLILPFILMAGLLLLLYCWCEWRSWAIPCLLAGFGIGAFPLIAYNMAALPGQDSFSILLHLRQERSSALAHLQFPLLHQIAGTVAVSLPTATGNPFCPVTELPFLGGDTSAPSLACTLIRSSWGSGYLLLWAAAIFLAVYALWALWRKARLHAWSSEERQSAVCQSARLMLLVSAGLTLLPFVLSAAPVVWPSIYSRYLVGLLIATPAVIWPLWRSGNLYRRRYQKEDRYLGEHKHKEEAEYQGDRKGRPYYGRCLQTVSLDGRYGWKPVLSIICSIMLVLLAVVFLIGTLITFYEVPTTQAVNRQQAGLIDDLLRLHVAHIYADYWTCDRIAFQSQEQIICGVLDDKLLPTYNRYPPYYAAVSADPHASYVFPLDSRQAHIIGQRLAQSGQRYQRLILDGYVVYRPM